MAHSKICSIPECGKPMNCRKLCRDHYYRLCRYGDPLLSHPTRTAKGSLPRYLYDIVMRHEGLECLPWPYSVSSNGYALINKNSSGFSTRTVSRIVCELTHGPAPTPKHDAAHSCGKGHEACVSRHHISWKTKKENQADRLIHGTDKRGEKSNFSKLTEVQVKEIRLRLATGDTHESVALDYGVSRAAISQINIGKNWHWLT